MKRSKKPTNWILVPANVQSEWDNCNYCLIQLTGLPKWKEWDEIATKAKQNTSDYYKTEYWSWCKFLNLDSSKWKIESWEYVTVTDKEIDELPAPESQVDCITINMKGDGYIAFGGFGKYTSEEYWSESVKIDELTNKIK